MKRDEIQKLIGGYATGTLTEAERKLLFDAALDDQELFDQLAHEQVLKELLEEPGVKHRLVTALGPEKPSRVFWEKQWPWAIAAAAACLAVVTSVVVLRTPEKPREIAAVTKPAEQPAPAVATQTQNAEPATPPAPNPVQLKAKAPAAAPVTENAPAPRSFTVPTPQAPAETRKAEQANQPSVEVTQQGVAAAPPPPVINGFVAGGTPQLQGGQIQIAPSAGGGARDSRESAASRDAVVVAGGAAPGAAAAPAGGRGGRGGGGGGRGGGKGGGGGAPQISALRAVAPRFAFDYSFDATGALRIVPAASGYLSVTVPPAVLFPSQTIVAGTPVIVQVPPDAAEVVVSFSASPGIAGAPVRRDGAAGTVEDQSPPNQRILVRIPVTR